MSDQYRISWKGYVMIKSALRPHSDRPVEMAMSQRLLHGQYDNLFKAIVRDDWCSSSDGNVESPTGYFSLITIERETCREFWNEFARYPTLADGQIKWMWSGQLAGYYVTWEDNNGLIFVVAYDDRDEAVQAYDEREQAFREWDDAAQADRHGFDGL